MKTEAEIRERLAKDLQQRRELDSGDPRDERAYHHDVSLALDERISLMRWILEEIR